MFDLVFKKGSEAETDSRKVASAFGLQHSHVLRDIRKIIAQVPENFSQSIFGLAGYQAQIQPLLADFDAA